MSRRVDLFEKNTFCSLGSFRLGDDNKLYLTDKDSVSHYRYAVKEFDLYSGRIAPNDDLPLLLEAIKLFREDYL